MKKIFASILLLLLGISTAQAGVIAQYNVTNFNGGAAPHGLFTFGAYSPETFTIDALFTLIEDDNTNVLSATLTGTLDNLGGNTGTINLGFENWLDTPDGTFTYKVEGGAPTGINADYFKTITGVINIDGTDFSISNCVSCGHAFQYGLGANAKVQNELGASAWIQNGLQSGVTHWDLNLAFTAVPEPTSLILMGMGLLGLSRIRRQT